MAELEQLQVEAGYGKKTTEKLNWMYEGPMQKSSSSVPEQEADDYLLGKTFESKAETEDVKQKISVHAEQPAAAQWVAKKPTANELFTRLHEDPIMKIKQQELKARELAAKNPLKMNRVKAQIEAQLRRDRDIKKEHKRKKKEAKKAKKREKKEAKKEKKKNERRQRNHRDDSSSTSGADTDDEHRDTDANMKRAERHHDYIQQEEQKRDASKVDQAQHRSDSRYGLQHGKKSNYASDQLGPSASMRKAKEDRDGPVIATYRPDRKRARYDREHMTDEERGKRLREMQLDASEHEQYRTERMRREREEAAKDVDATHRASKDSDPRFLRDIERSVYVSGNLDMEDRVKMGRQNHQRDLGESFMKR